MMKTLLLLMLFVLTSSCGRPHIPLTWPYEGDSLSFTGILHAPRGDIPIQGAFQRHEQEIRYAVIIQNGILLGTGRIDPASGRVDTVQNAPAARPVVTRIGKALVLFLECEAGRHDEACAWKQSDRHSHFHDKGLELDIPTQDSTCRTPK